MNPLDTNTVQFTINIIGETTGQLWPGAFRAKKRLSHMDRIRKDQIRRELLGSISPDSASLEAQSLATGIADLRVRLTEAPKWWTEMADGLNLEDENVLVEVYNQAIKIEQDAKQSVQEAAKIATKDLKTEQASG